MVSILGAKMLPKMVQKHDKTRNGFWNEFWMDCGSILALFWEPWGAHGLHFWSQNHTFGKDGHQNGAPKFPGTSLLAPWRAKGMPKCSQGLQRLSFFTILVPQGPFSIKIEHMCMQSLSYPGLRFLGFSVLKSADPPGVERVGSKACDYGL